MSRTFTPKVVTANALIEGDVIYLQTDGQWTRDLRHAELIEDEARANARLALGASDQSVVAGVYLMDAVMGKNGPEPTHFREAFRTRGPSNYPHGKQVELSHV
ncbi:DUF2849 domain-containing protein [Algirhabdus cladophorae]|uniref:DUF2849 domain-containing protein n=1 Tax=Algirhabdus cladophorae TaxID=3377108 RepID=UPI003B8452AB